MERYLIDTNILIDFLKGKEKAKNFIAQNINNSLISYVTLGELLQGARDKRDLKIIQDMLIPFTVDYGSQEIIELALEYIKKYNLKYSIDLLDGLIAATAVINNLQLATLNLKHFKMISGLKVINPIN